MELEGNRGLKDKRKGEFSESHKSLRLTFGSHGLRAVAEDKTVGRVVQGNNTAFTLKKKHDKTLRQNTERTLFARQGRR